MKSKGRLLLLTKHGARFHNSNSVLRRIVHFFVQTPNINMGAQGAVGLLFKSKFTKNSVNQSPKTRRWILQVFKFLCHMSGYFIVQRAHCVYGFRFFILM